MEYRNRTASSSYTETPAIEFIEPYNPRASLPAAKRFLQQVQSVCREGLDTPNPLLTGQCVDLILFHCAGYNQTRRRASDREVLSEGR